MIKRWIHKWLFSYKYQLVLLDQAKTPIRAYQNDAGYDLFVYKSIMIPKKQMVDVSTGVFLKAMGTPAWIFLTGRSSTLLRHGLIVDDGVIDGDYTGELYIKVYNPSNKDVCLYPDMRIGQMIILPHTSCTFKQVKSLESHQNERGVMGFGSTGV